MQSGVLRIFGGTGEGVSHYVEQSEGGKINETLQYNIHTIRDERALIGASQYLQKTKTAIASPNPLKEIQRGLLPE